MATDKMVASVGVPRFLSAALLTTIILYAAACFLPATDIGSVAFDGGALSDGPVDYHPTYGLEHLMLGWMDLPRSLPPWSANFVLLAGMICAVWRRVGTAAVLGLVATGLGLTTLTNYKHDGRHIGYYCWQASQVVFAAGVVVAWWWSRQQRTVDHAGTAGKHT